LTQHDKAKTLLHLKIIIIGVIETIKSLALHAENEAPDCSIKEMIMLNNDD
jgi:hypothetical protein